LSLFKKLDYYQKVLFLENYADNPSNLSREDLEAVLDSFPFNEFSQEKNLNFLALKLFRNSKGNIDLEKFAEKLNIDINTAEEILSGDSFEVFFPVAKEGKAELNRLLVIPLSSDIVLSTEPIYTDSPEAIKKLTGRGFFLTFSKNFDFKTNSYTLALYSVLKFGNLASKFAFTGRLTREGKIEDVEFLEEKLKVCREKKIPIIFPKKGDMESVENLEEFLTNLEIPLFIFPSSEKYRETFTDIFDFSRDYIKSVFHIDAELSYTATFDEENIIESFTYYSRWLEYIGSTLKSIKEEYLPNLKVGLTSNPLVFSFFAGVILSKKRLTVVFYKYFKEGEVYKPIFTIKDDRESPNTEGVKNLIRTNHSPGDRIVITRRDSKDNGGVVIKLPSGEHMDKHSKELAYYVNNLIRSLEDKCYDLILETPNDFAFALGYFLEDYKCLNLIHKGKFVYSIRDSLKKPYYLTNAFSLNMISSKKVHIDVEEIDLKTAKEKLQKYGFTSFISHVSTAQVLSRLLGMEASPNRQNLKLEKGDRLMVFQISVRPKEGQVFSKEEIEAIVRENKFKFFEVFIS